MRKKELKDRANEREKLVCMANFSKKKPLKKPHQYNVAATTMAKVIELFFFFLPPINIDSVCINKLRTVLLRINR
jgi:hypothetical protein